MNSKWEQDSGETLGLKSDWKLAGLLNIDTSEPSTPAEGEPFYHQTYNCLSLYNGSAYRRMLQCLVVVKTDAYTINEYECDGRCYTNKGATALVVFTLPGAAANLVVDFIVADTDGIKVAPVSGDTIRIAGATSATGIQETDVGGSIRLVGINDSEWIGISKGNLKFSLL